MDPLSMTASIAPLLLGCAKVAKVAHDIRSRHNGASLTMSSIATECAAVTTALSHLKNLIDCGTGSLGPTAMVSLDCVVAGCTLTLSVLDEYIAELNHPSATSSFQPKELKVKQKMQAVWNESEMRELLHQLQGHKSFIMLLLTISQSQSQARTHEILQDNNIQLEAFLSRARNSRSKKPSSMLNESMLAFPDTESIMDDASSILSSATPSVHDILVNSRPYRKAMLAKQKNNGASRSISYSFTEPPSGPKRRALNSPEPANSYLPQDVNAPLASNQQLEEALISEKPHRPRRRSSSGSTHTLQLNKQLSTIKVPSPEPLATVKKDTLVGWRMPYDLPLVPYSRTDTPWCATQPCNEQDWMGRTWPGYER